MQLRSYWKAWIEGWILVPHIPDQALDCIQLKPNQDGEKMWVLLPSTRSHLWEFGISTIFLRKYKSWTTHLCFHSGKDRLLIPARKKPSRYSFSGALLSLRSIFTWEEIDSNQFNIIGTDLNHRITGTSKALYGYIGSISNQKWEVLLGEHSAKCLFQKNWIADLTGFERPLESVSSPSDQKWEVILGEYPAPRRSWKIHPQPFHIITLCLQPHVNLTLSSETIQEALRIRNPRVSHNLEHNPQDSTHLKSAPIDTAFHFLTLERDNSGKSAFRFDQIQKCLLQICFFGTNCGCGLYRNMY